MRRKKAADEVKASTAKSPDNSKGFESQEKLSAEALTPEDAPVDQVILLKDFPKSADDVAALMKADFDLNCVFLIEELFGRDIDNSDEEDEINAKRELDILGPVPEPEEGVENWSPPKREKLFNGLKYRADKFEQLITLNRLVKKAGKNFVVKRTQFQGPASPMDIPEPTDDVPEPEIDQE